jgi:hypothetical protein
MDGLRPLAQQSNLLALLHLPVLRWIRYLPWVE